jgi:hypothetical protein
MLVDRPRGVVVAGGGDGRQLMPVEHCPLAHRSHQPASQLRNDQPVGGGVAEQQPVEGVALEQ